MRLAMAALVAGMVAASPFSGYGLAAASPLTCEVRSASHEAEHGGHAADSAYHVSRGELPTCEPANDGARQADDHEDDDKSRYCRKRWYC